MGFIINHGPSYHPAASWFQEVSPLNFQKRLHILLRQFSALIIRQGNLIMWLFNIASWPNLDFLTEFDFSFFPAFEN
jgi:hypothetical protein